MIAAEVMTAVPLTTSPDAAAAESLFELLAPWWMEICFLIAFPIGYCFLHLDLTKKAPKKGAAKSPQATRPAASPDARAERLHRGIEEDLAAGDTEKAVDRWRQARGGCASLPETLRLVVQAMASLDVATLVEEVAAHMEKYPDQLCNTKCALAVLDAVGHGKSPQLLDELSCMCRESLAIPVTYQWYEALLGGHAFAGHVERVDAICAEILASGDQLTARGYALIIKGFLCRGLLDVALRHVRAMRVQGFYIPPFAVTLLVKVASESRRVDEVLEVLLTEGIALPEEAVAALFEDCLKRGDVALADRFEALIRDANKGLIPVLALDPLLKLRIASSDDRASELWRELLRSSPKVGEGLLVGVLARCADAKFLSFAEEVAQWCRDHGRMTIALYSALMKAYAFCGFYGRACDLYPELCEKGLVPDAIMYGCLMRFAVECGRTELSQRLADLAPRLDTQNYISLIRAAGRDKDVARAFSLLEKLEASESNLDVAVYNCVLDACVCAGELDRARRFAADMRKRFGALDTVTYNTLVKGSASAGDLNAARAMLKDMADDGVKPNDITYNCVVNACCSAGDFRQAWDVVSAMQADGIKADHYTLSIMLKALKRHGGPREAQRVLALVDESGIDVCTEEVLLNTLLEVCTQLGETRRLQDLLAAFERSSMRPSLHLYGALIKAAGHLRRLQQCRDLWQELQRRRGLEPNEIVLGCMLDALVCNRRVSEAVALFRQWKGKLGANMVLISTLVKGFAAEGRADEAMDMWREAKADGAVLNAVVYNTLIDAQARAGRTDEVAVLYQGMKEDNVPPDSITYSTMVKSHCVKGDIDRAVEMLGEMQALGLCKDCVVFNTVLDWCTRHNRMDAADKVLATFEQLQIAPTNFTVGILVKLYGRRRMLDRAFEVARQLPAKWGFQANAQVHTCLMSACLLNGSLPRAFEVFAELRRSGVDSKGYGVLINGCVRAGKLQEAADLVEEAYGLKGAARVLPSWSDLAPETVEAVLRALAQRGLAESRAGPLLASLRAAEAQLDFTALTAACEEPARRPQGQQRQQQQLQQQQQQQHAGAARGVYRGRGRGAAAGERPWGGARGGR